MFTIDKIQKNDKNLKILKNLDKECFPDDLSFIFYLKKVKNWLVVEKETKKVAGYASAYQTRNFLFLSRCGIVEEFRGYKLQKKLIQSRIDFAISKGVKNIITYTSKNNVYSNQNIIDCGFKVWNDCPKWFDKGDNFIEWKLSF